MSAPLVEPVRVPAKHLPMLRYYLRAIERHARDDEPWDTEDDLTGELVISVEHEPSGKKVQE